MQLVLDNHPVRIKDLGPVRASERTLRTLVFVHGAGLSSEAWAALPRLCAAKGSSTYTVDLPGHGASGGPALPTIAAMAEWLARTCDALNLQRPILVGHSMGALVALHAAGIMRDRIAGLILVGGGLHMPVNARLLTAARETPDRAAAFIATWGVREGQPVGRNPGPTPLMRMAARRLFGLSAPGALASDLAACDTYEQAAAAAATVHQPALVLVGDQDRMVAPASGTDLAAQLPQGRIVIIPACGHMPMLEAPARLSAAIGRFIMELPA